MQRICRWFWISLLFCAACGKPSKAPIPRLTLFGLSLEAAAQLREDALEEFTRNTGIEVEPIPTLGTSDEQLKLISGIMERQASEPDVFVMDVTWPGGMHKHLLDLGAYPEDVRRQHLPALIDNNTVGQRLVALPFYVNAGVLFYRADLLKAYGYSGPPATWNDLDRMALRIQQGERKKTGKPFWGLIWQGAEYEGLTCNALEWQKSFGGGSVIEPDGTVSVNNQSTAAALTAAVKRVNFISPPSVLSYMETDTLSVFRAGSAAFMRYWSSGFRSATQVSVGQAGMALLPAGPGGRAQTLGGFQLGVSRYTKRPREAASLVLYLTGGDVQKRRAMRRGYVPTRPDLYNDPDVLNALPQLKVLQEITPASWVLRPSTIAGDKYGEVSRAYSETVHRILAKTTKPEPALQELEQKLRGVTQGKGSARN